MTQMSDSNVISITIVVRNLNVVVFELYIEYVSLQHAALVIIGKPRQISSMIPLS